jgi:hypothetical protein
MHKGFKNKLFIFGDIFLTKQFLFLGSSARFFFDAREHPRELVRQQQSA